MKTIFADFIPDIHGLVLAGGESKRMGMDKASILYYSIPQRDYLVQLLSSFVSEVYLSCHPDRLFQTNHPVITDTYYDLGPYGAVLSAFQHDPEHAWLVVACDMPLLDEAVISQLIRERDPSKVATCFLDPSTCFPEPLVTIWEPRSFPVLMEFQQQGVSSLTKVLGSTDCSQIRIERAEVLRSANTPEEALMMMKLVNRENILH